jgi:hypothetical protein
MLNGKPSPRIPYACSGSDDRKETRREWKFTKQSRLAKVEFSTKILPISNIALPGLPSASTHAEPHVQLHKCGLVCSKNMGQLEVVLIPADP